MARPKKTRVKSTVRSNALSARWKDPAYAAKMREAAKRGAATANARRLAKKTTPGTTPPPPPTGDPTPDPKAKARTARSWAPGRTWG